MSQPNGYIKTWVKIQYKLKMCPINTSSSACENKNNPGVYHIFEIPKKGLINKAVNETRDRKIEPVPDPARSLSRPKYTPCPNSPPPKESLYGVLVHS